MKDESETVTSATSLASQRKKPRTRGKKSVAPTHSIQTQLLLPTIRPPLAPKSARRTKKRAGSELNLSEKASKTASKKPKRNAVCWLFFFVFKARLFCSQISFLEKNVSPTVKPITIQIILDYEFITVGGKREIVRQRGEQTVRTLFTSLRSWNKISSDYHLDYCL